MKTERREYLLMIIGGTLTMFAGGLVQPIFAPFVRKDFTAPIFLVGLAVSGYFVVRMLAEFPIGVLFFSSVLTLVGAPFGYVVAFYTGAAMLVFNLFMVIQLREKTQT